MQLPLTMKIVKRVNEGGNQQCNHFPAEGFRVAFPSWTKLGKGHEAEAFFEIFQVSRLTYSTFRIVLRVLHSRKLLLDRDPSLWAESL